MSPRIVLATGPAGAGRTTAIAALEDAGFEAINNMPLRLVPRLLDGPDPGRPLALGLDPRARDFSAETLAALATELRRAGETVVLLIDCRPDVLVRRFSETRRRHPHAPDDDPTLGIDRELDLLDPVRDLADVTIDTSEMSPHDLRARILELFAGAVRMALSVHSFSYKRGTPLGLDLMFDVRFLRNPHWVAELKPLTGRDPAVSRYVSEDARYAGFMQPLRELLAVLLPAYRDEGKSHLTIGFGCTGGRHRSVAVVEALSAELADAGWQVSTRHRELEREGLAGRVRQSGYRT